jgi:micrococcal nuclease
MTMAVRRVLAVLCAALTLTAAAAAPADAAGRIPCRPDAASPTCLVWMGKVAWVADGDTPLVDVYGDGTSTPRSIRLLGVQAMEQHVYSPTPSKRRGECHALAATAHVEALVKAGGGIVRMTAQNAGTSSRDRPVRSIAVKINGRWTDIGLDLLRNGYAIWWPDHNEWAWNAEYRKAAQEAARAGKQMYDTDTCGVGPDQSAPIGVTVNYDADGNDAINLNGEWADITNTGAAAIPIGGWWFRDSGLRRYTFPAGTVVPAHGSVRLHVGSGTSTATEKYWGLTTPIFDNPTFDQYAMGDGGYLFDPQGDLRAWHLWPSVL